MTLAQPIRTLLRCAAAAALLLAGCAAPPPVSKPQELPVFPTAPDEARFYFERSIYTSADVVQDERNGELKRFLTGESRTGEGMGKPYGVAVHEGRVYVSDTALHLVLVFDIPKQKYFKIGDDDVGKLQTPMGLDVDAAGNLYVMDSGAKQIVVFDPNGKFLRNLGSGKLFKRPSGLGVDAAGSRVYVVDTGGVTNEEHHVLVFDAKSGAHLMDIGKRGSGPGELNLPRDVAIAPDGNLFVVDGANFRIEAFKPDGTFVRSFGGVGRQSGQFSRPKEVAVDHEGNIYVVDSAFGNFQIFTPSGELLLSVGSRSERDGIAKYMLPSGIAVDGDGRVYVVDQYFRKVDVYRPAKLEASAGFAAKPQPAPASAQK
jgi:DNA-binding beta-propeller fold protein YncE